MLRYSNQEISLLFVTEGTLLGVSSVLTINTTLRNGSGKEWSETCTHGTAGKMKAQ